MKFSLPYQCVKDQLSVSCAVAAENVEEAVERVLQELDHLLSVYVEQVLQHHGQVSLLLAPLQQQQQLNWARVEKEGRSRSWIHVHIHIHTCIHVH